MTTLTKTEAEAILERLADKTLSFGCLVEGKWGKRMVLSSFGDGKYFHAFDPEYEEVEMEEQEGFGQRWMSVADLKAKEYEILGHPILIGDVLEKLEGKIKAQFGDKPLAQSYASMDAMQFQWEYWFSLESQKLLKRWQPLGFTSSLQEIFNRLEWEDCKGWHKLEHPCDDRCRVAKPSPFADLFIFLKEIGL